MSQQAAVTVIATIKQEEIQNLKQLLKSMNDNVASNDVIPFVRLSNVHFARLFVLDESVDLSGVRIAPSLVYMGECDGTVERHLRELVDIAGEGLDKLYSCCLDYPASNERTAESRLTCLRSKLVKANAYSGQLLLIVVLGWVGFIFLERRAFPSLRVMLSFDIYLLSTRSGGGAATQRLPLRQYASICSSVLPFVSGTMNPTKARVSSARKP